jgi:hypothetical protein
MEVQVTLPEANRGVNKVLYGSAQDLAALAAQRQ